MQLLAELQAVVIPFTEIVFDSMGKFLLEKYEVLSILKITVLKGVIICRDGTSERWVL